MQGSTVRSGRLAVAAAIALAASGAAACMPTPEPVYAVRRSALIPHVAPPAHSGAPPRTPVQIEFHGSTVIAPVPVREAAGANAGLYIARHNLGGSLRVRPTTNFDFAIFAASSLESGSMGVGGNAAPRPGNGNAVGGGLALQYSIPVSRSFRIGLTGELGAYQIPYYEEGTCIQNCEYTAAQTYTERSTKLRPINSWSILPTWKIDDRLTVFAGLTRRNHPTNTEKQTQGAWDYDDNDELDAGPTYTIIGGGIEYELSTWFEGFVQVYLPITSAPVDYGPVLGAGLRANFPVPTRPSR
jgi:hypothetical protein